MNRRLLTLLTEIENSEVASKVSGLASEIATLSVKYQMIEVNTEDAILNYRDSIGRTPSEDEKKALEFGFMCGLHCE